MAIKQGFQLGAFVRKYMIIGILALFVIVLAIMTNGNSVQPINLVNVFARFRPSVLSA